MASNLKPRLEGNEGKKTRGADQVHPIPDLVSFINPRILTEGKGRRRNICRLHLPNTTQPVYSSKTNILLLRVTELPACSDIATPLPKWLEKICRILQSRPDFC